jgi:copper chaperone
VTGVEDATVHFNTGRIVVKHDPAEATVDDLVCAVKSAGYKAVPRSF